LALDRKKGRKIAPAQRPPLISLQNLKLTSNKEAIGDDKGRAGREQKGWGVIGSLRGAAPVPRTPRLWVEESRRMSWSEDTSKKGRSMVSHTSTARNSTHSKRAAGGRGEMKERLHQGSNSSAFVELKQRV